MLREFKHFLMKGNIVDLAVAFVIGLAFAAVIGSLVNSLIMPRIAMIIGKPYLHDLTSSSQRSTCGRSYFPRINTVGGPGRRRSL